MSSPPSLTEFSALIFDVYGTLADWETGLYDALRPLLKRYPASASWSRKDALTAFGSVETDLQVRYPDMLYSDLLAKVHQALEERLKALSGQPAGNPSEGVSDEGLSTSGASSSGAGGAAVPTQPGTIEPEDQHKAFGNSIKNWPIFKDTSAALHRLARHFKLVVLSNVDRDSFRYTHLALSEGPQSSSSGIAQSKLDLYSYSAGKSSGFWHPQETTGSRSPFTLIVTAQDVGCYKPALGGFQAVLKYITDYPELFGRISNTDNVEEVKSKTLSVAQSLIHDHAPAASMGMKSVWIDRQAAVTCNEDGGANHWTWRFETLGEFADAVEKEFADKNASREG